MLDVAQTRGFALSMPKAKNVEEACHTRRTARIAPSGNVTPKFECAHLPGRFGIRCEHETICPKTEAPLTIIPIHIPGTYVCCDYRVRLLVQLSAMTECGTKTPIKKNSTENWTAAHKVTQQQSSNRQSRAGPIPIPLYSGLLMMLSCVVRMSSFKWNDMSLV